ncbi:MAG: BTAD domain-containing putative transcriptional regulator [Actinomycetota bacterium]|nr:BTAD domain-containing putative transcriptional regulator [Actinomycetota bacterium]
MMQVKVLGPVDAVDGDGEPVAIGGPRQQMVVAALVLVDGPVSFDRLIEAVWPNAGSVPDEPRRALHTYVSRLRGAGLVIERVGDAYRLDDAETEVDAALYEATLREAYVVAQRGDPGAAAALLGGALELWRGSAFGDFADEEWARRRAASRRSASAGERTACGAAHRIG